MQERVSTEQERNYRGMDMKSRSASERAWECSRKCRETFSFLLQRDPITPARTLVALEAAAEICRLTSDLIMAQTPIHRITCRAAGEICEACASECEALGEGGIVQDCVEACRQTAQSCGEMAGH